MSVQKYEQDTNEGIDEYEIVVDTINDYQMEHLLSSIESVRSLDILSNIGYEELQLCKFTTGDKADSDCEQTWMIVAKKYYVLAD